MKEYISIKELQELAGLSYQSAREVIVRVIKKMNDKNYFVPQSKAKLALTWMVKKELGIK